MKKFVLWILMLFVLSSPAIAVEMYGGNIYENGLTSGDPQLQMYAIKVALKIFKNFQLPQNSGDYETKIFFKVDNAGNLQSTQITQSSGSKAYDASALAAVKKASPYPKPISQDITENGKILIMNAKLIGLVQKLNLDSLEGLGDFGGGMIETPKPGKKFVNPQDLGY